MKILPGLSEALQKVQPVEACTVQTEEQLKQLVSRLNEEKTYAIDTETTSLLMPSLSLVGISFTFEDEESWYIPVGHTSLDKQLPVRKVIEAIKTPLERTDKKFIFHHSKFDIGVLSKYSINIPMLFYKSGKRSYEDTMIMSWILDVNRSKRLKFLAKNILGMEMATYSSLFGGKKGKKDSTQVFNNDMDNDEFDDDDVIDDDKEDEDDPCIANLAVPVAAAYAKDDTLATLRLYKLFLRQLKKENLEKQYIDELKMTPCMVHIHNNGIMINAQLAQKKYQEAEKEAEEIDKKIKETLLSIPKIKKLMEEKQASGKGYTKKELKKMNLSDFLNLGSHPLRRQIFYDILGLKDDKTILTATGNPSTGRWAMQAIIIKGKKPDASKNEKIGGEVCENLLKLSKQRKLIDAFYKPLTTQIYNGRVYGSFNNIGTKTGRFSCIAKGTLVKTPKNPDGIPIEKIKAGDLVYSYGEGTVVKPVLWAGKTGHKEIIRLHYYTTYKKGYIDVTPDHKIKTYFGYKKAAELNVTDGLISFGYEIPKISGFSKIEKLNITSDVYCLEVADTHNFFAGEICVSNCSRPNLQQMPRDTKDFSFREIFTVPKGYKWVSVDLSQIELRVAAEFSRDKNLCDAYLNEEDLHSKTCFLIYGITPDDFPDGKENKEYRTKRTQAKTANFSMLYECSAKKLQGMFIYDAGIPEEEVPLEECENTIKKWFEGYNGVQVYRKEIHAQTVEEKQIETITGRIRKFPYLETPGPYPGKKDIIAFEKWREANSRYSSYLRQSFSTLIQGSSADLIKRMIRKIYASIAKKEWDVEDKTCKMLSQVHDELNFECPEETADEFCDFVKKVMSDVGKEFNFLIPVIGEGKTGLTWSEGH